MKYLKHIIFCSCSFILLNSCSGQEHRINGVSFVAARDTVDSTHVSPILKVNANYAAIMPFGFIRELSNPEIIHNTDSQWFGETRVGAIQYIQELRKKQIKVMVKPQIWVWRGAFTGYIKMNNEEDWRRLENSYTSFIMEYAYLAQEVKAAIFCIGTELEQFVENRPDYWIELIKEIKAVYSGKLTYAANWDEFKRTPFWDQLDYIGVDAYFPVSQLKTPTVEDCMKRWEIHKNTLVNLSAKWDRKILFTEYGYRSVDYAGKEPWKSDRAMHVVNLDAQVNSLEALYQSVWTEDWFAGGFIWKWFIYHDKVGGEDNPMFTPQNKPAEAVIAKYYQPQN